MRKKENMLKKENDKTFLKNKYLSSEALRTVNQKEYNKSLPSFNIYYWFMIVVKLSVFFSEYNTTLVQLINN